MVLFEFLFLGMTLVLFELIGVILLKKILGEASDSCFNFYGGCFLIGYFL